jgi:uncharacterized protein (TIGR03067 family)
MSALVLVLVAVAVDDGTSKKDLEALQGVWKVEKFVIGGREMPAEANERFRVIVKGDRLMFQDGEKNIGDTAIKLDATKKPAAVDMTEKGTVVEGIYQVKGDAAKLCWTGPRKARPTGFASEKDSETTFMVLKREKK